MREIQPCKLQQRGISLDLWDWCLWWRLVPVVESWSNCETKKKKEKEEKEEENGCGEKVIWPWEEEEK